MEAETRNDLEATVAARKELGPAHDQELIDGFLDRMGKELDRRIDEKVKAQAPVKRRRSVVGPDTLAVCIPIIVLAGVFGHVAGVVAAFVALTIIFTVAELRR